MILLMVGAGVRIISGCLPAQVVNAVEAVSKRDGESLAEYAVRVKASDMGFRLKLADLADNTDPARVARLDEKTRARLAGKYARMRRFLGVNDVGETLD